MKTLPRALIFDWDNTLIDSWAVIHRALVATFEAMGLRPWTPDETRRKVRASARDAFPALFGERAEEAQRKFYESYESEHLTALSPLPGAASVLGELARREDLFLSILSNKKGTLLRRELAHLGWDGLFGAAVGAFDASRDKPALEALSAALSGSNMKPGPDVWIIGDTDIDMKCAEEHGCEAVLVRPQRPLEKEFGPFEPLIWVADCRELRQKFRDIGLI